MLPDQYQRLAERTECDQDKARMRYTGIYGTSHPTLMPVRLSHAALGIQNEAGEVAKHLIRWLHYGHEMDRDGLKEELGDLMWHISQACNALGISLADVMDSNIRKLRKRYPDHFDSGLAREENRDREAEMAVLKEKWQQQPSNPVRTPEGAPQGPDHMVSTSPSTSSQEEYRSNEARGLSNLKFRPERCGVQGHDLECEGCGVKLYGRDVEEVCRYKGLPRKEKKRTKSEVLRLRTKGAVYGGCCGLFADNKGCDCLEKAEDDTHEAIARLVKELDSCFCDDYERPECQDCKDRRQMIRLLRRVT